MTRILRYAFLMTVLALAAESASAQVTTGTPPFGTFASNSAPDVINLANLNAHLAIAVLHKAGRGTDFTYDLSYDSSVWFPVTSGSTTSWQPVSNWGWRGATEAGTGYVSNTYTFVRSGYANACTTEYWSNWAYHDAWGVSHPFAGESDDYYGSYKWCGDRYSDGFSSTATDGSGYSIVVPASFHSLATLYSSAGKVINAPNNSGIGTGTSTDRNGNIINVDNSGNFYDTLSSTTPVLTVSGIGTPLNPVVFTYTAPSNAAASYTMNFTNYTVATNFGLSGTSEYKSSAAVPLVSSVVLPDGSQYSIQYEATPSTPSSGACTPYAGTTCVTARIKSVTLPTGGSITYTYTGGHNGVFSDGSTAGLTRTLSDGASWNATWTYTRMQGTGAASETTVIAPQLPYDSAQNQSILQFQGIYETQSDVYQGSAPTFSSLPISEATLQTSNLLQEVQACYNGSASPCTSTAVALPIGSQSAITILPGSGGLQSEVVTFYNGYGQLTEEDDYGYGAGAPGSVLRRKLISIQTVGTYQAIQTAQIQDGLGNVKAQTTMTFDQGSVTATSGTPQHSNPTVGRGNPTTISYFVQGSNALNKTLTYYDTGNVASITDVNNATTTYNYLNATSTCGNAFPTSVTEAISGLSQSMVWNCTGGVATSTTDENGKIFSTSYTDTKFWRPYSGTDQLLNITTLTYGGQTSVESSMPFNGTISTSDTLVTLDGLGRSNISQTKQSPTSASYDSVETDYDVVGRTSRVTHPYSGTAGHTNSSAPAVTTTYDALSRPTQEADSWTGGSTVSFTYTQNDVYQSLGPVSTGDNNAKRRQLEYDALGRLTSVCEVTVGTTAWPGGTCAQTSAQTGYWTKYTYDANDNLTNVTQNAQAASGQQQTRSYTYDDLSRMTSEAEPESGTTIYAYDSLVSDPNCGTLTFSGDLVKRTDAVGNTACSTYDLLHRNTSITYHGTYASSTPIKNFVYDAATVNSVAMTTVKTRLAEAYTCVSPCTSKITDLGFSYTARGETSDVYESTPHSGGYYHVPASYWANGGPNQLNNASCSSQPCLPGLPTLTYGADGEGRPSTVSASSGQNPVTGTTYNPYGTPPQTTVSFGSGDSDVFNSDANTGRMTQYKFNVGSNAVTGALTWNPNGTLGQLAITDPLNSSNAQTCNYTHDDLTRIASASCGSIWSQTFSFDAFGNINKSGNSSFGATYSPSTNRMTTIGSSTPTYDSNGNVTNDFLHSYAWDAEGRPVTIDTVTVTYDALGRAVELYGGGTYREIVYAPSGGKLALMSGQSLLKGFVQLTGGTTAVYSSSGLDHYRHSDWLGSARLATTPTQTVYGEVAYAPYGETYAASGNNDFSWTGINADIEPANPETLYDFPAREYGIQGRWPSPDPAGLLAVDSRNPQSWNRYAYVLNNPLAMTDPTGMWGAEMGPVCATDPIACIILSIFEGLFEFFGFGGPPPPPPPPQAAPAPPGGYGGGIDPYGTWNEKLPKGVRVFPSSFPTTSSNCDWCGDDYRRPGSHARWRSASMCCRYQWLALRHLLATTTWSGSGGYIVPIFGPEVPVGVGGIGTTTFNIGQGWACAGGGFAIGTPGGTLSGGPLTTGNVGNARNIANGPSVQGSVTYGAGVQAMGNSNGAVGGPAVGSTGANEAMTYSGCWGK
jgi:RHS repeat-associated protein